MAPLVILARDSSWRMWIWLVEVSRSLIMWQNKQRLQCVTCSLFWFSYSKPLFIAVMDDWKCVSYVAKCAIQKRDVCLELLYFLFFLASWLWSLHLVCPWFTCIKCDYNTLWIIQLVIKKNLSQKCEITLSWNISLAHNELSFSNIDYVAQSQYGAK